MHVMKNSKVNHRLLTRFFTFFRVFPVFLLSFQILMSACFLFNYHLIHNRTGGQLVSLTHLDFVHGSMVAIAFVGHFDQLVPNNFSLAIRCLTRASVGQGEDFCWLRPANPISHSNHNSYRFLGPFESCEIFCTTSIASSTLLMLVACRICCGVAILVG
jgi:hypothetical protein